MRRSVYSDAEIMDFVRSLEDGRPPGEICSATGVSLRTLYRWRRKFGGLKPFAVQVLRTLEQENRRLKAEAKRTVGPSPDSVRQPAPVLRSDLGTGSTRPLAPAATVVGRYAALRVR